ncbi:MAG: PQQ-binding-like beta-propeller repeat protein [Planctomycetales bacterium]
MKRFKSRCRVVGLWTAVALWSCWGVGIAGLPGAPPGTGEENWPAWRKDGSGVSNESKIPVSWSASKNILWKTPIPGKGNSSPIVWNDAVIVTTCTPGATQHFAVRFTLAAIWLLTILAVWRYAGGCLRDPLRSPHPGAVSLARRLVLVGMTMAVSYFLLAFLKFHVLLAMPVGVACAALLVVLGSILPGGRAPQAAEARPAPPGRLTALAQWLEATVVVGAVGAFLAAVHSFLVSDFSYSPERTWYTAGMICAIGLVGIVGTLPRTSASRLVAAALGLAALAVLSLVDPSQEVPLPEIDRSFNKRFFATAAAAAAAVAVFALEYLWSRRKSANASGAARSEFAIPLALAVIGGLFFGTTNFLLPQSVSLRQVICFDRETGQVLWNTTCCTENETVGVHVANTLAAPTAVTDGELIFVHFGGAGAYALDFSGKVQWHYPDPVLPSHWGSGSSPVLWKEILILTYDVDKNSLTHALDKRTGKRIWSADRTKVVKPSETGETDLMDCYNTPIVIDRQGVPVLVNHSNSYLCGYDPATGKELWHLDNSCTQVITTPILWKDYLVLGAGIQNYFRAMQFVDEGADQPPKLAWEDRRQVADLPSFVVYDDYVFTILKNGIASCRDVATGKEKWKKRIPGEFIASVSAADGKVFFCNTDGVTTVVEATPEYREVSQNSLDEQVHASPAISRGRLFVRGRNHLYCIGEPK